MELLQRLEVAVIKNNRILKCLLMMVVSLFLVLNFSIGVSAGSGYDRQEADACITISLRLSVKTSYGKSRRKKKNSLDYLKDIENKNGKYYADKKTIDEIGRIEAKGEDFSLLNKKVMSSRTSTEGGTSIVYRYSDEYGTKYMIHEVTDAQGYIIHRDFDAVRISSGQLINKRH